MIDIFLSNRSFVDNYSNKMVNTQGGIYLYDLFSLWSGIPRKIVLSKFHGTVASSSKTFWVNYDRGSTSVIRSIEKSLTREKFDILLITSETDLIRLFCFPQKQWYNLWFSKSDWKYSEKITCVVQLTSNAKWILACNLTWHKYLVQKSFRSDSTS